MSEQVVKASFKAKLQFNASMSAKFSFSGSVGKFGIQGDQYSIGIGVVGLQSSTLTVNTAVDSTVYSASINGRSVSINSGIGATTTTIATALAGALTGDSVINGAYTVTYATNVVTVVSKTPGVGFTLAGDTRSTASAPGAAVTPSYSIINKDHTGFTVVCSATFTGYMDVTISG